MRENSVVFLAMSGVRIRDQELLSLGLTLPGFVERGKVIASLPSLGLLTLAALTPPSWKVEYLEYDDENEEGLIDQIVSLKPSLVAISSLTARVFDAYRVSDRLRESGLTVVIGGLHATVMPQEAIHHADAVVVGEGEAAWPQLLCDFVEDRLQHIYRPAPTRSFQTNAPLPRYDLLDTTKYNRLTVQTTRGCPLDCSFCAASRLISPYKMKQHDDIRREIDAIKQIWPNPFIELADDNTFVSKKWSMDTVKVLREANVRWFTETDVSVADDPALLDALADSGCAQLLIGMEATTEEELMEADTKGWKKRRFNDYAKAVDRIQSRGISVNGCFVLGFDHSKPDVFERTLEFVRQCDLTEVQVTVLTPFPGTSLYSNMLHQQRLIEPVFWDKCTLFDVTYRPAQMSADELRNGFRWLVSELYSDKETSNRKTMFKEIRQSRRSSRAKT